MPKKIRLTNEQFISRAQKVHGNRYDYNLVNYQTSHTPIQIVCSDHGEFAQVPNSHLNGHGCPQCGIIRTRKGEHQFIEQAQRIHGNYYDYSKVVYVRNNSKVVIGCPIHGSFYQTPDTHANKGHGCPKCGNEARGTDGVYCKSYFESHETEPGFFYIIRMMGKKETFIKIGITKLPINKRYGSQTAYKYEPILVRGMTLEQAYNMEQQIIKDYESYCYFPKKHFDGKTECFTEELLKVLHV